MNSKSSFSLDKIGDETIKKRISIRFSNRGKPVMGGASPCPPPRRDRLYFCKPVKLSTTFVGLFYKHGTNRLHGISSIAVWFTATFKYIMKTDMYLFLRHNDGISQQTPAAPKLLPLVLPLVICPIDLPCLSRTQKPFSGVTSPRLTARLPSLWSPPACTDSSITDLTTLP